MRRDSGIGSLRAIIALAVLGILVFLAVKLLPPYVNNYQFGDDIESIARLATYAQGKTEDEIRNDVVAKASELGLPVRADQVSVAKTTYGVSIDVKYNVVVPVPGYTFNLKFNPTAGNKMITAR